MGETNRHISQYPLFCFFQLRVCYAVYFHLFGLQLKSIQQTAFDLSPFGKVPPVGPDPDTDDEGISLIYWFIYDIMNFKLQLEMMTAKIQIVVTKRKKKMKWMQLTPIKHQTQIAQLQSTHHHQIFSINLE